MGKHDIFLRLLRAGLWGESLDFKEMPSPAYRSIKEMAEQQTVTGFIGQGLIENGVRLQKLDAIDIYAQTEGIRRRNEELNQGVARLAALLNAHQIRYVVVKGQVLASFYRHPELRVPGDIDIYVHPDDMGRFAEVLKKEWNIDVPPPTRKRHVSVDYCATELEIHTRLTDLDSERHKQVWDTCYVDCFEKNSQVMIDGIPVATLSPLHNLLFVFMHMYGHFCVWGCGFRKIIDIAILLHQYKGKYDIVSLAEILKKLDVYDFFCAFGQVLIEDIGLPKADFPFTITSKHCQFEKAILHEVFYRGNHGKYHRQYEHIGILRSLETFFIYAKHCVRFYRLSPRNAMLFPKRVWALIKEKED